MKNNILSIDSLVPKNHLVRKIENAINFEFIYDEVRDLRLLLGAPSIDSVVLIKICVNSIPIWNTINETNYKRYRG